VNYFLGYYLSTFQLYLELGFTHILDLNATDHILFIIVMMCIYKTKNWKSILSIITSFTIGHTITLFLSVFKLIKINSAYIEVAIAVTIFLTCIENVFRKKSNDKRVLFSGLFGLIHGLGFSNYLNALLGSSKSIFMPLLAFNIGLELGQILLVALMFFVMYLLYKCLNMNQKKFVMISSILIAIQSIFWISERI
jgi:hypothetical protein